MRSATRSAGDRAAARPLGRGRGRPGDGVARPAMPTSRSRTSGASSPASSSARTARRSPFEPQAGTARGRARPDRRLRRRRASTSSTSARSSRPASATWPCGSRQLKARLAAEGLFDARRKRPLPVRPAVIAVVDEPDGRRLARHPARARAALAAGPASLRGACQVQGDGAARDVVAALIGWRATTPQCRDDGRPGDAPALVILARGGGSLEDLWSFNDERVVRAVVAHPCPVVCGVGHETDVTLADFAADVRAPTPSAAAELVVPDRRTDRGRPAAGRRRRLASAAARALPAACPARADGRAPSTRRPAAGRRAWRPGSGTGRRTSSIGRPLPCRIASNSVGAAAERCDGRALEPGSIRRDACRLGAGRSSLEAALRRAGGPRPAGDARPRATRSSGAPRTGAIVRDPAEVAGAAPRLAPPASPRGELGATSTGAGEADG